MPTASPQPTPEIPHTRQWLNALAHPPVRSGLERIFASAAAAIEARAPVCWASGRCCHFAEAGHRLYVTGLEAAYVVDGALRAHGTASLDWVRHEPSPATRCGFQHLNLCTVHTIKPLACRLYFCDRTAEAWQQETLEALIAEVRLLHDSCGVTYRYGEWKEMLALFTDLPANP
ncbi:MAG: hypothetical protein ACT4PL_02610 [Phycisphaerales bacterium]